MTSKEWFTWASDWVQTIVILVAVYGAIDRIASCSEHVKGLMP